MSLGLDSDYFKQESPITKVTVKADGDGIQRFDVSIAAKLMGMNHNTIRKGLQQGVFPWGYAIHTSENSKSYFINAVRFAEIEKIAI